MKDRAVIIEDSDSAKGFFSLYMEQYADQAHAEGARIIYWKNPCYQVPASLWQLGDGCFAKPGMPNIDVVAEQRLKENTSLIVQEICEAGMPRLLEYKYLGSHIGLAIASEICRCSPDIFAANILPSPQWLYTIVYCIINSISMLSELMKTFDIRQIFATEHTYRIGPLLEFAAKSGIQVPFCLENIPFCLKDQLNSNNIYEPRVGYGLAVEGYLSKLNNATRTYLEKRGREIIVDRVRSTYSLGLSNANLQEVRTIVESIADKVGDCEYIDSLTLANSSGYCPVVYTHAIADGLYNSGFDGFRDPYDYFISVLESTSLENAEYIIIRPHPELSRYAYISGSRMAMFKCDVEYLYRFIRMLRSRTDSKILLSCPSISLNALFKQDKLVHITQFGTVAIEALACARLVIYSEMAPYAGLGIGGHKYCYSERNKRIGIRDIRSVLVNARNAYLYMGAIKVDTDFHIPNRAWLKNWQERYGFSDENAIHSATCINQELRTMLKKTEEYELVYRKYIQPYLSYLKVSP